MLKYCIAAACWLSLTPYAGAVETQVPVHAGFTPDHFQVYVDEPTGFAFIRTPSRWVFVRKLSPAQMAAVPADQFVPPGLREAPSILAGR